MNTSKSIYRNSTLFFVFIAVIAAIAYFALSANARSQEASPSWLGSGGRSARKVAAHQGVAGSASTLTFAQLTESRRLTGLAGRYVNLYGSTRVAGASFSSLSKAQQAEIARWKGLASERVNLYGSTRVAGASFSSLSKAQQAEAARWKGMALEHVNLYGSTSRMVASPVHTVCKETSSVC